MCVSAVEDLKIPKGVTDSCTPQQESPRPRQGGMDDKPLFMEGMHRSPKAITLSRVWLTGGDGWHIIKNQRWLGGSTKLCLLAKAMSRNEYLDKEL